MPAKVSDSELSKTIVNFVRDGAFPESDNVVSKELSSTAIPRILQELAEARNAAEKEIESISRGRDVTIDQWVAQAKALQVAIEESKAEAKDIARQANGDEGSDSKYRDAAETVALRQKEATYNDTLLGLIKEILHIQSLLGSATKSLDQDDLDSAIKAVEDATKAIQSQPASGRIKAFRLLKERADICRQRTVQRLVDLWDSMIDINKEDRSIVIRRTAGKSRSTGLESVAQSLNQLNLLDIRIQQLNDGLEKIIVEPVLGILNAPPVSLIRENDCLRVSDKTSIPELHELLDNVFLLTQFLSENAPPPLLEHISSSLAPKLIEQLKDRPLRKSIPTRLEGIENFEEVISHVNVFAERLDKIGWQGTEELYKWVEAAPRLWIAKNRETLLDQVRQILAQGIKSTKIVERIETQKISSEEQNVFGSSQADDWDAKWSDDEEAPAKEAESKDQEEDASAWGFDDDQNENKDVKKQNEDEDDSADAWDAWDDDDKESTPASDHGSPPLKKIVNGKKPSEAREREVTLKETFTLTNIPETLLVTIKTTISDGDSLSGPEKSDLTVAQASAGLYQLPTLALAMFRAVAPAAYEKHSVGGMHVYNDSMWLAEELRKYAAQRLDDAKVTKAPAAGKLRIDPDINSLITFAKRAYSREMESQRRVIADLLDGAQGFANCTTPPYAAACDNAIGSTIDQLQRIADEWKIVLSKSALLQSIGSLLASATNKIIIDIEDLDDISEPESQQLAKYFSEIGKLEAIFLPEQEDGSPNQEVIALTAVYCPTWLKFQYLSNILEGSLVDIKYLWTEGELGLEFTAEEVVELIQALFADSEHRRRAIGEIRRTSLSR